MNNNYIIYMIILELAKTYKICYDSFKRDDLASEELQKLLIETMEIKVKNLRKEVEERKISKLGKVVKLKVG